jgi:hypothetical protein
LKVPEAVGDPLMVITFDAHDAETPAGSPVDEPIPVAPVVVWVIFVSIVLMHIVGVEEATLTVLAGVTIILPVAKTSPHPPVKGIL